MKLKRLYLSVLNMVYQTIILLVGPLHNAYVEMKEIQNGDILFLPLTNSKGSNSVIYFAGLEFPMVICPTIHGEPLFTTQAFYYLDQLESVAKIRFQERVGLPQHDSDKELERIFEYIIDNYLFELSKEYPYEKLSSMERLSSIHVQVLH